MFYRFNVTGCCPLAFSTNALSLPWHTRPFWYPWLTLYTFFSVSWPNIRRFVPHASVTKAKLSTTHKNNSNVLLRLNYSYFWGMTGDILLKMGCKFPSFSVKLCVTLHSTLTVHRRSRHFFLFAAVMSRDQLPRNGCPYITCMLKRETSSLQRVVKGSREITMAKKRSQIENQCYKIPMSQCVDLISNVCN